MKVRVPKEELAKYFIGKERASYVYDVGLPDLIELEGEVVERTESYGVSTDDNGKPVLGQWPAKGEEKFCAHCGCTPCVEKMKPLPPLPEKITIYGTHYHCKKCGAEMTPIKRQAWKIWKGVTAIHECPRDGELLMEYDKL